MPDRAQDPVEVAAVEQANAAFYAAFETGDMDAMQDVWVGEGHAVCIHPGWNPVVGAAAVRRSWAVVMANTTYIQFILTDVGITLSGEQHDVACVTCTENVLAAPDGEAEETRFSGGKAVCTNIFRRQDGRWRLWIHHASPVMSKPGADEGD